MFTLVGLALAYTITRNVRYSLLAAYLIENELGSDQQPKEYIRLGPGAVNTFDLAHVNYTWNALIPAACRWSGIT